MRDTIEKERSLNQKKIDDNFLNLQNKIDSQLSTIKIMSFVLVIGVECNSKYGFEKETLHYKECPAHKETCNHGQYLLQMRGVN